MRYIDAIGRVSTLIFAYFGIDYYRIDLLMWIRRARGSDVCGAITSEGTEDRTSALSAHDGAGRERETQCGVRAPGG